MVKNLSAKTGDTGFYPWDNKNPQRRNWQPAPVLLPGKSQTEEPGWLQPMRSQSRTRLYSCTCMESLRAKFILDLISGEFQLQSPFLYPNPGHFISYVQQTTRDSTQNLVPKLMYREEIIEAIKGKIQKQFEPSDPSLTQAKAS